MDGSWEWGGGRYTWRYGSWVIPPPNARYAPWVLVRRAEDGQLFFAPSDWKDEGGHSIADRAFETALGPAARARARPDGPPASDVQVGRPHGGAPSNGAREGGEEEDEGL